MDKAKVRGTLLGIFVIALLTAVFILISRSCGFGGIPVPAGEETGEDAASSAEAGDTGLPQSISEEKGQDDKTGSSKENCPEEEVPENAPENSMPEDAETAQNEEGAGVRCGISGSARGTSPGGQVSPSADVKEQNGPPAEKESPAEEKPQTGGSSGKQEESEAHGTEETAHVHSRAVRKVPVREAYDEEVIDTPAWDEITVVWEAYDEPVYGTVSFVVCNTCGRSFPAADELFAHQAATMQDEDGMHGGYHVEWEEKIISYIHHDAVTEVVHHDAVTHTEHHPAEYREEVYCSTCGEILEE